MILLFFLFTYFTELIIVGSESITYTRCRIDNECISLRDCKSFINFISWAEKPLKPPVVKFLREQQCGFEDGFPKVCCLDIPQDELFATPPKEHDKACNRSKCVSLKKCRPYMELIHGMEKPLKPMVVKFLRQHQCGFRDDHPMVCCSLLPKNLQMLKHGQSSPKPHSTKELNKLSNEKSDLSDIFSKVETTTTPSIEIEDKNIKEKAEFINREFDLYDFFDYVGPLDLNRGKRFSNGSEFGIEIR